jgi:hypothetical protein
MFNILEGHKPKMSATDKFCHLVPLLLFDAQLFDAIAELAK